MEKVNRHGLMGQYTTENGKTVNLMDKGNSLKSTGTFSRASGTEEKLLAMPSTSREHSKKEIRETLTKATGETAKRMVRVKRVGLMVLNMKAGIKMTVSMVKELYFLLTVPNTPENSSKEPSRALEHTNGSTGNATKAIGRIAKWRALVSSPG